MTYKLLLKHCIGDEGQISALMAENTRTPPPGSPNAITSGRLKVPTEPPKHYSQHQSTLSIAPFGQVAQLSTAAWLIVSVVERLDVTNKESSATTLLFGKPCTRVNRLEA